MRKKRMKSGFYWVRMHHGWDTEPEWQVGYLYNDEWVITGSPNFYTFLHVKEIGEYLPRPTVKKHIYGKGTKRQILFAVKGV